MRIFAERFNFEIHMESTPVRDSSPKTRICAPEESATAGFCKEREDCLRSGETTFRGLFPAGTG